MEFLFTCPHCGTRTEVDRKFSGAQGACVTCGRPITIPDFDGPDASALRSSANANDTFQWRSTLARKPLAIFTAGLVFLGCLVAMLVAVVRFGGGAVSTIQTAQSRAVSTSNLKQIAKALNAYADDYGRYPPAYTVGPSGTPLHSWRVLILPYLGEKERYESIQLDLPWDNAANQQWTNLVPDVYSHPRNEGLSGTTPYQVLLGPRTIFAPGQSKSPKEISDGRASTLLVVEVQPDAFTRSWMQPTDLDFRRQWNQGYGGMSDEIRGMHSGSILVATANGQVHQLDLQTPVTTIQAMITPNSGDSVPAGTLRPIVAR
ncbi:DUF1559 family PulG-like putative transporter [Crateriforma spongiae]|uniref:DUF1559 family PulG-like putative transporter n=1 Tax=Crateriforma spongiae TaxID=2724528 RepID=UPI00144794DF|nr:DUF1559 domain-containing protein [Crateriforma spongiae]